MTAVEGIVSSGRPLNLQAVMEQSSSARSMAAPASGKSGFSFGDFVDVINPLQHIPGIAELYRSVTNDRISDEARKTGNALYGFALGGPIGLGAMLAYNAVGDRLGGGGASPLAAEATPVAETAPRVSAAQDAGSLPVPSPKPERETAPLPKPDPETVLLGESVAATAKLPQVVPSLTGLASQVTAAVDPGLQKMTENTSSTATAASSVAYVEKPDTGSSRAAAVPTEDGLSRLATHQANHLPLDVLKALQERHAQRTSSERS